MSGSLVSRGAGAASRRRLAATTYLHVITSRTTSERASPDGLAPSSRSAVQLGPLPVLPAARAVLACVARSVGLLVSRRIRQPVSEVGLWVRFADGSATRAYRETVIDREPPLDPAVLIVAFRLRRVCSERAHALFRFESELNTLLFAGFPGLCSKLWFAHDDVGTYRGIYEWDGPGLACDYARALARVLALVSEPGSIRYHVLAGLRRDQLFGDAPLTAPLPPAAGQWWLPVAASRKW